jgi:c(7)-type cytochrome triheme protein
MAFRRKWTTIPGLFALAAAAVMLSAYSGASSDEGRQPDQPVDFPHPQHVNTLGMSCLYCHFSANNSPDPGMPAVGTCMGCHTVIATDRPEIKKLAGYWTKQQPVPWVRIHRVPEYVRFPHMRHVNSGVSCQTCHGDIQDMTRVYQAESLNMGWCIDCHVGQKDDKFKARYDCTSCHY